MSYANTDTLYVWSDGKTLYCESDGKEFTCTSPQEMWDHLRTHQRKGDYVPRDALERLWHEARGLPYETDVERSLKALKEAT